MRNKEEIKIKNITPIIGSNLSNIRFKKNLSLDEVAKITGVSKAMLGQIERGESNPTVSTLWKIATGLKVSFSSFMDENEDDLEIIDQDNIAPIVEENSCMRLYPIFPFDVKNGFEIFTIELESNCRHQSSAHDDGVEEYIIVTEGHIEIVVDDKSFSLTKGNSIRFKGNRPHCYRNLDHSMSTFQNIIIYQK